MIKHRTLAAIASTLLVSLAAAAAAHGQTLGGLRIDHPWIRATAAGAPTAAGYLTVTNTGGTPDRLLGGSTPAARGIEIHVTSMAGGIMRMRPVVGGLPAPAGRTVTLAPGGYHLMIVGPKQAFRVGERIPVTLRFEHAGAVKVDFHVEAAPTAPAVS